jgi:hypothetical protein
LSSPYHPARLDDPAGRSRRQIEQARKAEAANDFQVFLYGLGTRARSLMDQHDSRAGADANRAAVSEEMDLLDYGLSRAGTSAAKVEMVARAAQRLATSNDRRITRRFSG